jgi:hypothetical protein
MENVLMLNQRGLGKGTWGKKSKIDAYLDKLRNEWQRP